jgi:hypothetical protein
MVFSFPSEPPHMTLLLCACINQVRLFSTLSERQSNTAQCRTCMFHARLPHHYAQTHDLGNVAPEVIKQSFPIPCPTGHVYKCRPVNFFRCFCPSSFFLFLCHPFNAETAYLDARWICLGKECTLVHTWLCLWNRESPRCQPRWVARARGMYAVLQTFPSIMYYFLHSHGLLQASLTTLETLPS